MVRDDWDPKYLWLEAIQTKSPMVGKTVRFPNHFRHMWEELTGSFPHMLCHTSFDWSSCWFRCDFGICMFPIHGHCKIESRTHEWRDIFWVRIMTTHILKKKCQGHRERNGRNVESILRMRNSEMRNVFFDRMVSYDHSSVYKTNTINKEKAPMGPCHLLLSVGSVSRSESSKGMRWSTYPGQASAT